MINIQNAHAIAGDIPDFMVAQQLSALAHELFATDAFTQAVNLDEEMHELILTMQEVGLIEMAIAIKDGVQIVLYRITE